MSPVHEPLPPSVSFPALEEQVLARWRERDEVSEALGSPYDGDLTYGRTGQLFVFARGTALVRFADYRGRATFTGFERPLDVLPRDRAVLSVRDLVVSPADAG